MFGLATLEEHSNSQFFFTQPPRENRTSPTPDNRYPGKVALMNDGRLVTDYRSRCETNMPTGTQFAARRFLQKNADQIIDESRNRQMRSTGVTGYLYDKSQPPFEKVQSCSVESCDIKGVNSFGYGIQRNESVPELFGTFSPTLPSFFNGGGPRNGGLTSNYEGGRNTPRS